MTKEKILNIRIDEKNIKDVQEYAKYKGNISISALIRFIVTTYIREDKTFLEWKKQALETEIKK